MLCCRAFRFFGVWRFRPDRTETAGCPALKALRRTLMGRATRKGNHWDDFLWCIEVGSRMNEGKCLSCKPHPPTLDGHLSSSISSISKVSPQSCNTPGGETFVLNLGNNIHQRVTNGSVLPNLETFLSDTNGSYLIPFWNREEPAVPFLSLHCLV